MGLDFLGLFGTMAARYTLLDSRCWATTLPLLALDPVGFQTNRAFKLCMTGEVGASYEIQANTNLVGTNWTVLGVMQNTNGIWRYSDVTASNSTYRAYRARQLP